MPAGAGQVSDGFISPGVDDEDAARKPLETAEYCKYVVAVVGHSQRLRVRFNVVDLPDDSQVSVFTITTPLSAGAGRNNEQ